MVLLVAVSFAPSCTIISFIIFSIANIRSVISSYFVSFTFAVVSVTVVLAVLLLMLDCCSVRMNSRKSSPMSASASYDTLAALSN